MVREPTVGYSGVPPDVGAYSHKLISQSVWENLIEGLFEHNPPTHLDATHQTTSFSADQMIQFSRAVGLEASWRHLGCWRTSS